MKPFLCLAFCITSIFSFAQIADPGQAAKRKATDRANNKVDQGIDKGLDKVEEGIGNLFKKKKKKDGEKDEADTTRATEKNMGSADAAITGNSSAAGFQSYSKFDFVPGEKVIFYEDFDRIETGDFPADWNTDASGELVTISGKEGKWLNLTKNGSFIPEAIKELPENATLEFEVGIENDPSNNGAGFGIAFHTNRDEQMQWDMAYGSFIYLHPGGTGTTQFAVKQPEKNDLTNLQDMPQWTALGTRFAKISVWRQKNRLRLYINQKKLWDIPRFFAETKPYYIAFARSFFEECNIFLSNIKLAAGAPDTRSKLITEGRFSTTGILFDVNSDRIKPTSAGMLKEIANTLAENPQVRIKIIGHTDSDGDDASNLSLSKKRALAVKNALSTNFGIEASRMETDGMGETKPADSNATAQGKANNRRVEFIKL